MAITITVNPDIISAAYRPVIWTATSDDVDIVRMIADVKVDGVIRANIDKDPNIGTANEFDFDIQSVVQDFLTENLEDITSTTIVDADKSEVAVVIDLYEVVQTTADTLSTEWEEDGSGTPDLTSSEIHCVNATLQHEEDQDLDDFTVDNANKRFLTNSPSTLDIGENETAQLGFLTNIATNFRLRLIERDIDGFGTNTDSDHSVTDKRGVILIHEASMLASTVKFTIQLLTISNVPRSEVFTYNIKMECKDEERRIKWLNPLGGIDSYTFISQTSHEVRFANRTFQKRIDKGFSVEDRGETVLQNRAEDHFQVFSKAQNKEAIEWLGEIGANGVNAWIDNGTNKVPIIITGRKSNLLHTRTVITQMAVRYKLSNKRESQHN